MRAAIFVALAGLFLTGLLAACGGSVHRPLHMDKRSQVERLATYAYEPTRMTDTAFQYPGFGNQGLFEWRTLSMQIETGSFVERGELVLLAEMHVENRGTREFRWDDYTVYLALHDGEQWRYRMLFSPEKASLIPAGAKRTFRFRTRLASSEAPDQFAFVFQNILGGRDVAFPFHRHVRAKPVSLSAR
jgi:hypothetical protein